ncbi:MAG: hypothetical protein FJ387_03960 [Verrucomicrobia bacterium]|nr:hypothetical protein [Verrucomicrobiota bacterium]
MSCDRVFLPGTHQYTCNVTSDWVDPVDLDGDGIAEFWHGSYRQTHTYFYNLPGVRDYYVDYTEALFPAEHVQLYAHPEAQQGYRWNYLPTMLLEPGQRIQVNPQPECPACESWAWDPPAAQIVRHALGMGTSSGTVSHSPCYDVVCYDHRNTGFLSNSGPTNGLFGFRVLQSNGSHSRLASTSQSLSGPTPSRRRLHGRSVDRVRHSPRPRHRDCRRRGTPSAAPG